LWVMKATVDGFDLTCQGWLQKDSGNSPKEHDRRLGEQLPDDARRNVSENCPLSIKRRGAETNVFFFSPFIGLEKNFINLRHCTRNVATGGLWRMQEGNIHLQTANYSWT
jgi:hypothetical protein